MTREEETAAQKQEIADDLGKLLAKVDRVNGCVWYDFGGAEAYEMLYRDYMETCRLFKLSPLTECELEEKYRV